jgi:hypothetical protein
MRRLAACLAAAAAVVLAAPAYGDGLLVAETEDWRFEAPDVLGSQADLELNARQIQLCTDDLERLLHHRPRNVERFTWRWVIGGGPVSWASPLGVETHVPAPSYPLVDPAARAFREGVVARGVCFGPHEITHVMTWESWRLAWPNEGFATFTDWLYQSASWRYGQPLQTTYACDQSGWTDGFARRPYSDLRNFAVTYDMYATAACFWVEVHRHGGFPAIRRILMRLRSIHASTPGELVVHHVNPVLGLDFRPIARRYGFTDADLTAAGAPPLDPPPPSLVLSKPKPSGMPRARRQFRLSVDITRSDTGDPPSRAAVACPARAGATALRASSLLSAAARPACGRFREQPAGERSAPRSP